MIWRIFQGKRILHTGDWSMQGYVNYPGGMIYQYKVPQLISDKQVLLHLGEWRGTLLKVRVNGEEAGFHFEKKDCVTDVTDLFEKEEKHPEIEISGSPRNMFGPFHQPIPAAAGSAGLISHRGNVPYGWESAEALRYDGTELYL